MLTESLAAPSFDNPIVDQSWNIEFAESFAGPGLTLDPENKPTFNDSGSQTALEDSGSQVVALWATDVLAGPSDESDQTLTFTLTTDNDSLFAVAPAVDATSGALTYTPANDAYGTATVTAVLDDGADFGLDSTSSTSFDISVAAVNDAPSFVAGDDLTLAEDSGSQILAAWAADISSGPSNEGHQMLEFELGVDNEALFSDQPAVSPASGDLSFTPAPDANGMATVSITLIDDGGTTNGGSDSSITEVLVIEVTPVPDAPVGVADSYETSEDTTLHVPASGLLANDTDADGDPLWSYLVSGAAHGAVELLPSGEVTYEPDPDYHGTDTLVYVASDGGLESDEVTVEIVVLPVNDRPGVTATDVIVPENSGRQNIEQWARSNPGNIFELDQTFEYEVMVSRPDLFATQPSVDEYGTLTFIPAPDACGKTTIDVTVTDSGIDGVGRLTSDLASYRLTVTEVDGPPALDSDGDGIADFDELAMGLDPFDNDTDGDEVEDGDELEMGSDPRNADTDGDGLDDGAELGMGTDPLVGDSDGDGLGDGEEYSTGSDPGNADSDADGLDDGAEIVAGTDPLVADSDGDGVPDGAEVAYGFDPLLVDWQDVEDSIFRFDVLWAVTSGITRGCTDSGPGEFCASATITRGQVAAFLVRAFDFESDGRDWFSDDNYSLFEDEINALATAGVTRGCGPDSFCPEQSVTRGELAAMMARALELSGSGGSDYFHDDDGSIFETDINRLAAAGVTTGCGNGTYCPDRSATRGEVVAYLHRALGDE